MRLSVKADLSPVFDLLSDLEREQLPFAASIAMTRTAENARKIQIEDMSRALDRPKPSTVNERSGPIYVKTASKAKWPDDYAEVRVKDRPSGRGDPAIVYLSHNIHGGARVSKRSENVLRELGILPSGHYVVPPRGSPDLDRYGNIRKGVMNELLAALGSRNARRVQKKRLSGKALEKSSRTEYIVASRDDPETRTLPPGVWRRKPNARRLEPVLIFVRGAPTYRRRIRFYEKAEEAARLYFEQEFDVQMRRAIASRKVRPNPLAKGL